MRLPQDASPRLRSQRFRDQPDTRTSWGAVLWGKGFAHDTIAKSENLVRAARSDGLEVKVGCPRRHTPIQRGRNRCVLQLSGRVESWII